MAKIPINNFDKFIKSRVETHQTPVDTERLWSNIQKTNSNKKSGILPGALLLLLITLFVSVHLLKDSNSAQHAPISKDTTISASLELTGTKTAEKAIGQQSGIENVHADFHASSCVIPASAQLLTSATVAKHKISSHTEVKKKLPTEVREVSFSQSSSTDDISVSHINFVPDKSDLSEISTELIPFAYASEGIVSEDTGNNSSKEGSILSITNELTSLPSFDRQEFKTSLSLPEIALVSQDALRIQHVKNKKALGFRLHGGAGKVVRNMKLIDPEAEQWMHSRNTNEHQLEAVKWGMDIKFSISKNVYFFTGIEDMRINEQFNYESTEERRYLKENQLARVVHGEDTSTEERGTVYVTEEIHKSGIFYNQIRMINIPIGLGFTQRFGKFGLGLEGSILVNAFHRFDGKIADASNVLLDLNNAGMKVSQIQTARFNGVFSFHITPAWSLQLNTGVDLPMKSMQLGQYMSQNYLVYQANLGICYNW